MPVRGYKIKTEPQSSEQSNSQIKPIQDINPDDVFIYASQYKLFQKYYPYDLESEVADKIFAMMKVLEHFRTSILNSHFLSPRDQLSKCRGLFSKALSQHQTSILQERISKNQLSPSAYLQNILSIKKLLEAAFANVDIDEMIKLFNVNRTEINAIVQSLSQIRQKYQTRDKEFQQSYSEFQKIKKTFVTQVSQLREYHQSRRCTSLIKKNNLLLSHFKKLCKVLSPKQMDLRDKGINYFNDTTQYFLEIKAGYLGLNITQKINYILQKFYSKKEKTNGSQAFSDNEYDENEEGILSLVKDRNRRNTRLTSSNSKQVKKNLSSLKDDTNDYEYEEEEEEEDYEEEEEDEYEEEEEEEEEEEVFEIDNQSKRNKRTNLSKSVQAKKTDNRRTRSSTSSNIQQRLSAQNRTNGSSKVSATSSNNNRKQRGRVRNRLENNSNDDKTSFSNSIKKEEIPTNKRGRSRNTNKGDSYSTSSTATQSSSSTNTTANRGRRGQTSTRLIEKNNGQANNNSSNRSKDNQSIDFSSRKSKRRRTTDDIIIEEDEDNKAKSNSSSKQESSYNKRISKRSRDKDGKDNQGLSSTNNNGNQGKGRSKHSSSNSLSNTSNEIEIKAQERKLVCNQINELTIPLLEIIGRDSLISNEEEEDNETEFLHLILNPLRDLYKSDHPTEIEFNLVFNKSYKEFKSFLESKYFQLFPIKLFYMVHEIEIYKIINNFNNRSIDQLITSIYSLPDKLNKYQQVQQIESIIIELIDKLSKPKTENSSIIIDNFGNEPSFLANIFDDMFNTLTPIICLIKTLMPFNSRIKANKLTRSCDYLYIPYCNYLDRQSNINSLVHYQQYISAPFKSINPDQYFDNFIFILCKEIENNGIQIYHKSFESEFNCLNIYVPKINELLKGIQNLLSSICSSVNDENLNQISSNFLAEIYDIGKIIEIEKSICTMNNSQNLASVIDIKLLLSMIKTLRNIHFLFIALDGRSAISYSNALNITYARMFVEQICQDDILNDQFLCAPIDPSKSIKIKNILNAPQIESLEEKLKSSYLIRMKSLGYFQSKYFVTLFNIENIKAPVLKTAASSLYPPEMSDLIFMARLKPKKNEENHSANENEILLIKQIFGIDKDFGSINQKFGNICIKALSDIYLDLLEMIAIRDKLLIIPPSLSNFLALRSQSSEFAEKICIIENFKEFVLIIHETFRVNIVSIINSIIKEIENIIIPQPKENEEEFSPEASEKIIAFLILTIMKRGYLSTATVSIFIKFITDENNKLYESFTQNQNLMKLALDLCKIIMFIDIHDKIIKSISSINNVSILRNINLGMFCSSISRSLLFLNSTSTIIISNQSSFSINKLTELNKYGQFALSHINEIDHFQKEELVESLKLLYPILPTSSDINNDLSEEKMSKIEPEQKEKAFLRISCSNVKTEIDDFIRFQSDSNKRTLKMTNPIILQLLNSTNFNNNKNIIIFLIYAFDIPKSLYSNLPDDRSCMASVALKQEKRNERLKKIDEVLQFKEMQYIASSDSLFIPIPCSLLSKEQQEIMAQYYQKLQDERDELVIKEKIFQEYLEKKEKLLRQTQEQIMKRKELTENFYQARDRLKQVAKKAQKQQESNKKRLETEQSNPFSQSMNKNGSLMKFENDTILTNQLIKNKQSIKKIQKDLDILDKRTKQSLEYNRNFKNTLSNLNRKIEDRQELVSKSSSIRSSSNDLDKFGIKDFSFSKIDEFVKNSLIEMDLASEKTFDEIEKTADDIKKLEEGTADEEACLFIIERLKDIQQSEHLTLEEKENYISLLQEIMKLKKEKDALQNNQG